MALRIWKKHKRKAGNGGRGSWTRVKSGSKGFCELKENEEKFEKRLMKIGGEVEKIGNRRRRVRRGEEDWELEGSLLTNHPSDTTREALIADRCPCR
ncbi:unnamed protein product [Sphenostylis stenocarpa]|uniref:Uncharacterized protein n=1 Tax=Sphenostylis stenocarpa TaxID=92480 RepID=A0AA86T3F7_9FABA|nr:unnamed protein product [Sphenostylis stenocarpa]